MKNNNFVNNIDKNSYYGEVRTRERIVQMFIIISGFLVAYSKPEGKDFLVSVFIMYILFTMLYYIFLTRTKNNFSINMWAIMSSYMLSLLLLSFIIFQFTETISTLNFSLLFITLVAVFSFALISPKTSNWIVEKTINFEKNIEIKHPKFWKIFIIISMTILLIAYLIVILPLYLT